MKTINTIFLSFFLSLTIQSTLTAQKQQVIVDVFWPIYSITNNIKSDDYKTYGFKLGYEQFKKEDLGLAYTLAFNEFQTFIRNGNGLNDSKFTTGNVKFQVLLKKYEEMPFNKGQFDSKIIWGGFANASLIYKISERNNPSFSDESLYAPILGGGVLFGYNMILTSNLKLEMLTGMGMGYSLNPNLYENTPESNRLGSLIGALIAAGMNTAYLLSPSFSNINLCYTF